MAKKSDPVVFEITGRKTAVAMLLAMLAGMLLVVIQLLTKIGFIVELFGAGLVVAWLALEAFRLYTLKLVIELSPDHLTLKRGATIIHDGPIFAVKATTIPLMGLAFAVEPMTLGRVLTLNFNQVFVINARRNRLALPGVFLSGLRPVLDHIRVGTGSVD